MQELLIVSEKGKITKQMLNYQSTHFSFYLAAVNENCKLKAVISVAETEQTHKSLLILLLKRIKGG